jgi:hypothetical protein
MKRILYLFFFLSFCSQVILAQSFTIINPASKKQQFIAPVGSYIMDTIIIKNNTAKRLSLVASISPGSQLSLRTNAMINIDANQTTKSTVMIQYPNGAGIFSGTILITDAANNVIDQIGLQAEYRSYAFTDVMTGRQTLDFTNVKVGEKACQTVWAKNGLKQPVIISAFGFAYGGETALTATPHGTTFPIVMLPGEEMPIADVCFAPTRTNQSEFQWLTVTRTPSDPSMPNGTSVDINASSAIDSNLLKPCLVASVDTSFVGPILFDGSIDKTITLSNNRYQANTVSGVDFTFGDVKEFSIVGNPFPLTIDPISSKTLTLRFSPHQADPIVKYRYAVGMQFNTTGDSTVDSLGNIHGGNACGSSSLAFVGLAMTPTADSISTPLFPDKEYDLGMTGTSPSFSQDFYFQNNTSSKIKIVNVSLQNPGAEFNISNIAPSNSFPFTLDVGDKMTVTVTFTPSIANRVFFNQVIITTEQGLMSQTFPIQAMRQGVAKVSTQINPGASLQVNPNPSKDKVTISLGNAEPSSIEIYDLLGKRIFGIKNVQEITIEAHDLKLQPGMYFIRAVGTETTGMPFTITKKLIIE